MVINHTIKYTIKRFLMILCGILYISGGTMLLTFNPSFKIAFLLSLPILGSLLAWRYTVSIDDEVQELHESWYPEDFDVTMNDDKSISIKVPKDHEVQFVDGNIVITKKEEKDE